MMLLQMLLTANEQFLTNQKQAFSSAVIISRDFKKKDQVSMSAGQLNFSE